MADCKDPDFVKSQLKPTKDAIKKLKTTHADFFKSIETNKKLFEQYLNDTGLKDTYENTHTGELKRTGKNKN